jgi:hypothetical protein
MVAFFLFIGWSMKGIYRLHYGSIRD